MSAALLTAGERIGIEPHVLTHVGALGDAIVSDAALLHPGPLLRREPTALPVWSAP